MWFIFMRNKYLIQGDTPIILSVSLLHCSSFKLYKFQISFILLIQTKHVVYYFSICTIKKNKSVTKPSSTLKETLSTIHW